MLKIIIPKTECWDETEQEFVCKKEQILQLEHSLISISKWESRWLKPFLSKENKTPEETEDYVKCMTIFPVNPDEDLYLRLTGANYESINKYIQSPMTATVVNKKENKAGNMTSRTITSELIYYWMIALNIPPEYQKWHINRLLTLIQVCNTENQPAKKMSKKEIMSRNTALNEARRKAMQTRG